MEEVFIVYKTDSHHSYKSRDIIGIATDKFEAIRICVIQSKKEGYPIKMSYNSYQELFNLKQSQSYKGEGEFQYESVQLNTLL